MRKIILFFPLVLIISGFYNPNFPWKINIWDEYHNRYSASFNSLNSDIKSPNSIHTARIISIPSANYPTIKVAVDSLNTYGPGSGGVIFDVNAGHTETNANIKLTTTLSNATDQIIFQKSGSGANPRITAGTGVGSLDGIIVIAGTDYVTFDGIDIIENTSNTTSATQMEWGYAILKASATNASRFITIKNCRIGLRRLANTNGTYAIYSANHTSASTTALTIGDTNGTNSYNKFYGNIIDSAFIGISLNGYNNTSSPFRYYDHFNEIGVEGGNTVYNIGNSSSTNSSYGIYAIYQDSIKVNNNTINTDTLSNGGAYGIYMAASTNSSAWINKNYVSVKNRAQTWQLYGIYVTMGDTLSGSRIFNKITVDSNTVENCYPNHGAFSNSFYAISATSKPRTMQISGNTIKNNRVPGTGYCYLIQAGSGAVSNPNPTLLEIYDNSIYSNQKTGASAYMYCITTGTSRVNLHHNKIYNDSIPSSSGSSQMQLYGIYNNGAPTIENYYDNEIYNLGIGGTNSNGTNTIRGIVTANSINIDRFIFGNKIYNLTLNLPSVLGGSVVGIYNYSNDTAKIFNNKIYSLYGTTGMYVWGMYLGSGSHVFTFNNYVFNLYNPTANYINSIYGINGGTPARSYIYNNTIYLDAVSSSTSFGSAGLYIYTSTITDIRNNIIINKSVPGGGSLSSVSTCLGFSATTLTNYSTTSDRNNLYAGPTSDTNRALFFDGTNKKRLIADFKSYVSPREQNSFSENTTFRNTSTLPYDVRPDSTQRTLNESGASILSLVTNDGDSIPKYPNSGYPDNPTYPANAPDVGANEFGGIPGDRIGPSMTYTQLNSTLSTSDRTLSVNIKDTTGVPTTGSYLPRIYFKKFFSGTWYSTAGSLISGTGKDGNWDFTITYSLLGGVIQGDSIYYFVIAQDSSTMENISANPGTGLVATNVNTISTYPSNPYKYKILVNFTGTYSIGTGKTFPDLDSAARYYNTYEITGPVTYELYDEVDSSFKNGQLPIKFNQNVGSNYTNSLTIKPASGVNTYISGNISGSAIIQFYGADYITIDGSNNGSTSRNLSVIDSNSGSGCAIWVSSLGTNAGAKRITVKNCIIKTGNNSNTLSYALMVGGTSFPSSGNDNDSLTIQNNSISKAYYGIAAAASNSSGLNNFMTISGNTIGSGFASEYIWKYGIYLNNDSSVVIEKNRIYNIKGDTSNPSGIYSGNNNSVRISKNDIDSIIYTGIYGSGGKGIDITGGNNYTVDNNILYCISGQGYDNLESHSIVGIRMAGGIINVNMYYNSVNLFGEINRAGSTGDLCAAIYINSNASSLDVRDNVFNNSIENTSGVNTSYAFYSLAGSSAYSNLNYNDYYASGAEGVLGYFNGGNITNITDLRTATGKDVNSMAANPLQVSNSDLRPLLGGSPLIGAGYYIPSFTTDILDSLRSVSNPTIGAYEKGIDLSGPAISYSLLSNDGGTINRVLTSFAAITDLSGVNTTSGTSPRIYYKKSVNSNTYAGNTSSDNGWKWTEATNSTSPFSFIIDYSKLYPSGTVSINDTIQYFVIAQDLQTIPNVSINSGIPAQTPVSVNLTASEFPLIGTINSYIIQYSALAGDYYVGIAEFNKASGHNIYFEKRIEKQNGVKTQISVPMEKGKEYKGKLYHKYSDSSKKDSPVGVWATITAAVNALNLGGVSAPVRFLLTDETYSQNETFPITVNKFSGASVINTVTIRPNTGVQNILISGNSDSSIFKLNGSDFLYLDGSNSGTDSRNLTVIDSTLLGSSSVIKLSNYGSDTIKCVKIKNCIIRNNNKLSNSYGIKGSFLSSDSLLIENNLIAKAGIGIYIGNNGVSSHLIIKGNNIGSNDTVECISYRGIEINNALSPEIFMNIISGLYSYSQSELNGIYMSAVNSAKVYKNNINNIQQYYYNTQIGGQRVTGISLYGYISIENSTIYNNIIFNIRAFGKGFFSSDCTIGIFVDGGSYVNIYFNTIYLDSTFVYNGSSMGKSTPVYLSMSDYFNLRDNVLRNGTKGNGKSYSVYIDQSYDGTIDYNSYYTDGQNPVLGFFNGDKLDSTAWRNATGQDVHSIFINPKLNSPDILIPVPSSPVFSAGINISGITKDILDTLRGNPPAIGAYEKGNDLFGPVISYTPIPDYMNSNATLTNVTINDIYGVDTTSNKPRIYYKKITDANTYIGNNSSNPGWKYNIGIQDSVGKYHFDVDYTKLYGGSTAENDTIQYFVIAQDVYSVPNVTSNQVTFSVNPVSVNLTSGNFPASGTKYYKIIRNFSGEYHIGNGKTFPNLDSAVKYFNNYIITGPVTFLLDDAIDSSFSDLSCIFPISIKNNIGSSFINKLTIKPNSGVQNVLISGKSDSSIIQIKGSDYVIIDGSNNGTSSRNLSIIDSALNNGSSVIKLSNNGEDTVKGITIKNCFIRNNNKNINTCGISGRFYKSDSILIENNRIIKAGKGIYFSTYRYNLHILNLVIKENNIGSNDTTECISCLGIEISNASSPEIFKNTISGLYNNTGDYLEGISIGSFVTNANIYNNNINNIQGLKVSQYQGLAAGIALWSGTNGYITIFNNIIFNIRAYGKGLYTYNCPIGIFVNSGDHVWIYFNTIYLDSNFVNNGNSFGMSTPVYLTNSNHFYLRDNIFRNSMKGYGKSYSVFIEGCYNGTFDYNSYYTDGQNPVLGFYNQDKLDSTAWRNATGQDTHSVFIDPKLRSPEILIPKLSSPVLSAGIPISGITKDYIDSLRNVLTPSIGAYEYGIDATGPSISYSLLTNTGQITNRILTSFAAITDSSGVNITSGTSPRIYYKKLVNNNTYAGNTSSNNGWKWTEATNSTSPFSFIIDYSKLYPSGTVSLDDTIQYFIIAQDLQTIPNVSINNGIFARTPSSVNLSAGEFPLTGTINKYAIHYPPLAGDYYVGITEFNKASGKNVYFEKKIIKENKGESGKFVPMENGKEYKGSLYFKYPESNKKDAPSGVWATITAAIDVLNSGGITAPVRFILTDATYSSETLPITINQFTGGSSTNTVTIKPNPGVTPIITGSSTSAIFKLNGADYVIIDGSNTNDGTTKDLTISDSAASGYSVWINSLGTGSGANRNTIKNCNILMGSKSSGTYGIYASGDDNDSLTILNNSVKKSYVGISVNGTSDGNDDVLYITGNTIGSNDSSENIGHDGIIISYVNNSSISKNTVFGIISSVSPPPVGITISTEVKNSFVSKNKIDSIRYNGSSGYGGKGIYVNTGNAASNLTFDNNVITRILGVGNSTILNSMAGMVFDGTTGGLNIYFNSVCLSGTYYKSSVTLTAAILFSTSTISNINARNNVFRNNSVNYYGPSGTYNYAIYSGTSNSNFTNINYNDYRSDGSYQNMLGFLGSNKSTIADWRSATGKDVNSFSSDPQFISASDLRPKLGSPLLSAGTSISGITYDYLDSLRNISTPSVGAYEKYYDVIGPAITYTALSNIDSLTNRTLYRVKITDPSFVDTSSEYRPRIYYKRTSDTNTFIGNTSSSGGWKYNTAVKTSTDSFSFYLDYSKLSGDSGVASGTVIQYFLVAQDKFSLPNVSINKGFFTVLPSNVQLLASNFPVDSTNSYRVNGLPLAGDYNIGITEFNKASGKNIYFEKRIKKEIIEVPVYENQIDERKKNHGDIPDKISYEKKEVETQFFIPMENGEEYQGELYFAYSNINKTGESRGVWATITTAVSYLNMRGVSAPVRFLLTDATYSTETLPITIDQFTGGSAANTVTIKPNTSVTTVISGSSTSAIFKLNGADYVVIDGSNSTGGTTRDLAINNSAFEGITIWLYSLGTGSGAKRNTIKNCNITGAGDSGNYYNYVIKADGKDNDSLTIQNNSIRKSRSGIIISAESGGVNNALLITGNSIGSNIPSEFIGVTGIFINYADGCMVSQNNVFNINSQAYYNPSGIQLNNIVNSSISRNKIDSVLYYGSDNQGSGRGIWISTSGNANLTIDNNIISRIGYKTHSQLNYSPSGIFVDYNSGGLKIYYNSVFMSGNQFRSYPSFSAAINFASQNITNIDLRNNIFYNSVVNSLHPESKSYAICSYTAPANFTQINNNDYYVSGSQGIFGFINGADVTTLNAWKTATGKDTNSISQNPVFLNSSDLRIDICSPVIGAGIPISGFLTDYLDSARSLTASTIGAFEKGYNLIPPDISYSQLSNANDLVTPRVIASTLLDCSGMPQSGTYIPRVYFKKNFSGTWTSTAGVFTGGTSTNAGFNFTINHANVGGVNLGDSIYYYIIAQDSASPANVGSNPKGVVASDVNNITSHPANPNKYKIVSAPLAGTYTVGLSAFNKFTGKNLYIETFTRRIKEIIAEEEIIKSDDKSNNISGDIIAGSDDKNGSEKKTKVTYKTVEKEIEYGVIFENGSPYKGPGVVYNYEPSFINGDSKDAPMGVYTNISAAVLDLNERGVSGAVTFSLVDTAYTSESFPVILSPYAGASYTNSVTFKPASGNTAVIRGNDSTAIFKFNGGDYYIIDGSNIIGGTSRDLTINNTSSYGNAILISSLGIGNGAVRNTIKNCNIKMGYKIYNTYGINATGSDNDSLTIQNNSVKKAYTGIYINASASGVDNALTISGNSIGADSVSESIGRYGIQISYADDCLVLKNTVFNIVITGNSTAYPYGISILTGVSNSFVSKNKIDSIYYKGNYCYGGQGIYVATGNPASNLTIDNNVISRIGGVGGGSTIESVTGITVFGTTGGLKIYYNSICLNGVLNCNGHTYTAAILFWSSTITNVDLRDNVFTNSLYNPYVYTSNYAIISASTSNFTNIDYNDYFASGTQGRLGYIGGSAKTTISEWRSATGKDTNSISADPLFMSNTDLRPKDSSLVISAGVPISGFPSDFLDTLRSVSAPTIGAYEKGIDVFAPSISYTPLSDTGNTGNRYLNNVCIYDVSTIDTSLNMPRIYYKRLTDSNTYIDNTSLTNGWKFTSAVITSPDTFSFYIDYSKLFGGTGVSAGTYISYFIVAQDKYSPPNVGINSGTFASPPLSVQLASSNFPVTSARFYKISGSSAPLSGDYIVGNSLFEKLTGLKIEWKTETVKIKEKTPVIPQEVKNIENKITKNKNPRNEPEAITPEFKEPKYEYKEIVREIKIPYVNGTNYTEKLFYKFNKNDVSNRLNASELMIMMNNNLSGVYPTLTSAINDLNERGVSGQVRFLLADADYSSKETFPLVINNISGASYLNNIVFKPAEGISPIVSGNSGTSIFSLNGADYVIIDGSNTSNGTSRNLTIKNNLSYYHSIRLSSLGVGNGALRNTIKNCNILTDTNIYNYSCGIVSEGYDNDSLTIQNNFIKKASYGIKIYSTDSAGKTNALTIVDNYIGSDSESVGYIGILANYTDGCNISGNTVYNIYTPTLYYPYGIALLYSVNSTISRNKIDNVKYLSGSYNFGGGTGIYINSGNSNSNIIISNNVITNIKGIGDDSYVTPIGMFFSGTTGGIKIYFNSVYMNGNLNKLYPASAAILFDPTGITNVDLRDNIFRNSMSNTGSSYGYSYGIVLNNATYNFINYNDYYVTGTQGRLGYINGSAINTITAWRTATGQDSNSISADPLFYNVSDLRLLQNSPVISAGTSIAGITTDYQGDVRNNPPSIGAFEKIIDLSGPVISYSLLSNTNSVSSRFLSGVHISDLNKVDTTSYKPRLYYKRNSDTNMYIGNTSTTGGWKYATGVTSSQDTFSFYVDYSILSGDSGVTVGTNIQYFVIAQDDRLSPNLTVKQGNFTRDPTSVQLTASNFPVNSTYSYKIISQPPLSGDYTVGAALFEKLSGLKIHWKPELKKVKELVFSPDIDNQKSNIRNKKPELKVIEKEVKVPYVNGVEYTDKLLYQPDNNEAVKKINNSEKKMIGDNISGIYPTLTSAVNDINERGVSGPVRFLLVDTLYSSNETFPININYIGGASSVNTVTIKPSTGVNSTIVSTAYASFILYNSQFINIDGANSTGGNTKNLTLNNTLGTTIYLYSQGSDVLFKNSVKNCIMSGNINSIGVYLSGICDSLIVQNNIIRKFYAGIYSDATSKRSVITGNIIGSTLQSEYNIKGIEIYNSENLLISDNYIFNCISSGYSTAGIKLGNTINSEISRNRIDSIVTAGYDPPYGIQISSSVPSKNLLISNNIISRISSGGNTSNLNNSIAGLYCDAVIDSLKLYYNSVYLSGNISVTNPTTTSGIHLKSTDITHIDLRNNAVQNSIVNASNSGSKSYAIYSVTSPSNFMNINYNDYYASGTQGVLGYIGGADKITLSAWQTATGQDKNSYSGNPMFTSTSNLFPDTSSANCWIFNGKGMPISLINYDYAGNIRSTVVSAGPTDIGAYEFNTSTLPPSALESKPPIANDTTTYWFANRKLIEIKWGTALTNPVSKTLGNDLKKSSDLTNTKSKNNFSKFTSPDGLPANVTVQYYSGVLPPDTTTPHNSGYSFWFVNPNTNPTDPYDITIYYGDHELGKIIGGASNMCLAKYDSATRIWLPFDTTGAFAGANCKSIIDPVNKTIKVKGLTGFGVFTITSLDKPLNRLLLDITVLIEGLYYDGGFWGYQVLDTVSVIFRDSTNAWSRADSLLVPLDSLGHGRFFTTKAKTGAGYYLVIKHRNALETWSSLGNKIFGLSTGLLSYNFTTSQDQAYGNNLLLKNSVYCIYSGDCADADGTRGLQDGLIDANDMAVVDNDSYNYLTGWEVTDLNGDLLIDLNDMAIIDNNAYNYIQVVRPPDAPDKLIKRFIPIELLKKIKSNSKKQNNKIIK
jgi:hypothetical protein